MAIKGTTKITSKPKTKQQEAKEKKLAEELISNVESVQYATEQNITHETHSVVENNKSKVKTKLESAKKHGQVALKKISGVLNKANKVRSKQVAKARGVHPKIDKLISKMDYCIEYLTKPKQVPGRSEVIQHTRSAAVFGVWVTLITFGMFLVWGFWAQIDSGSVAQGQVVLESQKRLIQHLEGGLIEKIYVKDGDTVKAGDLLIELDEVAAKAKRDSLYIRMLTYLAEHDRLKAERDGLNKVKYSDELLQNIDNEEIAKIIESQDKLFHAREEIIKGKIEVLRQNIKRSEENKKAALAQEESTRKQISIVNEQIATTINLLKKGNATKERLRQLEANLSDLEGRKGHYLSTIAEAEERVIQSEIEIQNVSIENSGRISEELRKNHEGLTQLVELYKEADHIYNKTKIYSPVDGVVNNLMQQTEGGAIQHGGVVMEIVPQNDILVVDAQVQLNDIDRIIVGQEAKVRIAAFKSRVVPPLDGKVVSVSPDVIMPKQQGEMPHYKARIEIDKQSLQEVSKSFGVYLYPGMQAQVIIVYGPRTLFRFLMDPFIMSFERAFREK